MGTDRPGPGAGQAGDATRIALVLLAAVCFGLPVRAQPPPELADVQGKYQAALQNIARTYEDQITELNRQYLVALHKLRQQMEARDDDEGVRLVEAEIEWVNESRDQIPHPWELLEAASEGVPHRDERRSGAQAEPAGQPLVLGPFWNRSTRSGRTAQKELQALFEPYADAGVDLEPAPGLMLCRGVTYLMPMEEAVAALDATRESNTRLQVETPGIPERSFYYYTCTGEFEDRFQTVLLVTDAEDRVVAVQFMRDAEDNDRQAFGPYMSQAWRLYDLVQNRQKASSDGQVGHRMTFFTEAPDGTPREYRLLAGPEMRFERVDAQGAAVLLDRDPTLRELREAPRMVMRIDSLFAEGHVANPSTRLFACTRLYLPRQLVSLVLQRVGD